MVFYAAIFVLLIPILGQLGRFSIGSGGLLLLDILLPIFILFWFFDLIQKKQYTRVLAYPIFYPIIAVLFLFLAALLFNAFWINSWKEIAEGFFYWIRYSSILFFSVAVFDIASRKEYQWIHKHTVPALAVLASLLAIIGFIQLWVYPDFAKMAEKGWDPHIGRLLSTWFDPNFLGSFFSYVLIISISVISMRWKAEVQNKKHIIGFLQNRSTQLLIISIFILLVALLLTYSRSALLAFVLPVTLIGMIYFRTFFLVGCLAIALVLPFSPRAVDRISDGVSSAFSLASENAMFVPDATARLRVENFQEGISLGNDHFFTGIGFNVIRTYKTENIHSAGGFDSSLLTVFVCSGFFGLFAFLFLHFKSIQEVIKKIEYSKNADHKGLGIGILANMIGVFAQSFFINSLFFPFFILYFWTAIALFLAKKQDTKAIEKQ